MGWSAVSWAYKDEVTSAKLAQMQENIRSHAFDGHASIVGHASTALDSGLITAEAEIRAELRVPVTLRAQRRYFVIGYAPVQVDSVASPPIGEVRIRNSGSAAAPTVASAIVGAQPFALTVASGAGRVGTTVFGWIIDPPAGQHHLSLFGIRINGGGNLTFTEGNAPAMFLTVWDAGSLTLGSA